MPAERLFSLASTIRSKNAGVNAITFDIIFRERANFERVRDANVITKETMAKLYGIELSRFTDFVVFEPANAIKFTITREVSSGAFPDADVFGSQQYSPLFDVMVP